VGDKKYYCKGKTFESYDTIFGKTEVERNTFQNSDGGATICPMEVDGGCASAKERPLTQNFYRPKA
jgi:hypothetical protein